MKGKNMSRKEIVLVVDVETAGGFGNPLVYDLGIAAVVRSTGEILESHSLAIKDILVGRPRAMKSAYYAEKLPQYFAGIGTAWRLVKFATAQGIVSRMVEKYGVKRAYAYNANFDANALDNTANDLLNGLFMPSGVKWACIWSMACQTILKQKRYHKFAHANGLVSPAGNVRTSAEAAYAYMTGQPDFVEAHTGLSDVLIEVAILSYVLRQKKKVDETPRAGAWKLAQVA